MMACNLAAAAAAAESYRHRSVPRDGFPENFSLLSYKPGEGICIWFWTNEFREPKAFPSEDSWSITFSSFLSTTTPITTNFLLCLHH